MHTVDLVTFFLSFLFVVDPAWSFRIFCQSFRNIWSIWWIPQCHNLSYLCHQYSSSVWTFWTRRRHSIPCSNVGQWQHCWLFWPWRVMYWSSWFLFLRIMTTVCSMLHVKGFSRFVCVCVSFFFVSYAVKIHYSMPHTMILTSCSGKLHLDMSCLGEFLETADSPRIYSFLKNPDSHTCYKKIYSYRI